MAAFTAFISPLERVKQLGRAFWEVVPVPGGLKSSSLSVPRWVLNNLVTGSIWVVNQGGGKSPQPDMRRGETPHTPLKEEEKKLGGYKITDI